MIDIKGMGINSNKKKKKACLLVCCNKSMLRSQLRLEISRGNSNVEGFGY